MSEFSNSGYGTQLAGSNYTLTLNPESGERPKTPSGLIVTRAVQIRHGWLGQVIVDKSIVWETVPLSEGEEAIQAANAHVVAVASALFGSSPGVP